MTRQVLAEGQVVGRVNVDGCVRVDVCIATFKRPAMLDRLLRSLESQQGVDGIVTRFIVVDNDPQGSARGVTERFASQSGSTVIYDIQPEQNISLTRNRCLALMNADFAAFVDDDEFATPTWLRNMVDTAVGSGAAAVIGPVDPVLPPNAPSWIRRGRFFQGYHFASGEEVRLGATGNALVRADWVRRWPTAFDPEFGLSGGEDTEFFSRIRAAGGRLIWCDEALVHEEVSLDRLRIGYLMRRAVRGGQCYARITGRDFGLVETMGWVVYRVLLLGAASAATPFAWLFGQHVGVRVLLKVCTNFGQLSVLSGARYEQYRQVAGSR